MATPISVYGTGEAVSSFQHLWEGTRLGDSAGEVGGDGHMIRLIYTIFALTSVSSHSGKIRMRTTSFHSLGDA
ncbi:hypothetical protein [Sporosarcina sp. NPDC096371]|uniref:hypothetical protein n=1 Tax=Sporosarcina sp. NPDC096371 TaxID=3364530 RepID=UPI003821AC5B